jgi:hypothetical protein
LILASSFTMTIKIAISVLLLTLITGCGQQAGFTVEKANRIMLAQVAKDVTVDIETASEKLFVGSDNKSHACGRAIVNQPGLVDHQSQRFIISADKEFRSGIARFETYSGSVDTEFQNLWNDKCENLVLPPSQKPNVIAGAGNAKPVPAARKKNFDINAKTWPVDVAATDPVVLASAVSSQQFDRQPSKFETTAEYKAKIAKLRSNVLYDDVVLGGAFAIDGGPVNYNADAGSVIYYSDYAIGYSSTGSIKVHGESASPESLSSRERSWDDYYKKEKYKTITHSRAVYLSSKAFKPYVKVIVEKKMPRDVAKASIDDLRVVYVGNIMPPYFYTGEKLPQDSETDVEHQTLIEFDLKGIWLVNFKTGEILSKKFKTCEITARKC